MPAATGGIVHIIGRFVAPLALLAPWPWAFAARPAFDFSDGPSSSSSSSFAEETQHASLEIKDVDKFTVERISNKEMMRLRTKGMGLHEVRHRHFNRDPHGANSLDEEDEEQDEEDPDLADNAMPSAEALASALLDRDAGNMTESDAGSWPFGSKKKKRKWCNQTVQDEMYNLSFVIRDKGDGHVYLRCAGSESKELKASCDPDECGADTAWCFVKRGCGGTWGRRCKKVAGTNPRMCSSDVRSDMPTTTNTTTTTGTPSSQGEAFLPPASISPSQMTGYVCVQFDLDLTMLSGGIFPGLFSVGLLGDVHYLPSTQCWGWTNQLMMQFSLGLEVGGVAFRVGAVFIATLVVSEQPLNAARNQLAWELPYDMDTSKCHTKDPFSLIEKSFKRQWKHVVNYLLSSKKMKESAVQSVLRGHDHQNHFEKYIPLLNEKSVPKRWQELARPNDDGAEGHETQALVKNFDSGRVDITITHEGSDVTIKTTAVLVPDGVERLLLIVWQDWDAVVIRQESAEFPLLLGQESPLEFKFRTRGAGTIVGAVVLLTSGDLVHQGPFTLGLGDIPSKPLVLGIRDFQAGRPGTLAIKSVAFEEHDCKYPPDLMRVSVLSSRDHWEEATWYPKDMGKKSPWGVRVNRKIIQDLPNEAAKMFDEMKPTVSLSKLLWRDVAAILKAGLMPEHAERLGSKWLPEWDKFMDRVREALKRPAGRALDVVDQGPVKDFLVDFIWTRKAKIAQGMFDKSPDLKAFVSALQDRLEGHKPSGREESRATWKWTHHKGRSVNPDQCKRVAKDEILESHELCMLKCRSMRPADCQSKSCSHSTAATPGKDEALCNVARTDREERMCSLWQCKSWQNYPHTEGYEITVLVQEDEMVKYTMPLSEIFKHISKEQLEDAVNELSDDRLRTMVDGTSELKGAEKAWRSVQKAVLPQRADNQSKRAVPAWKFLSGSALRGLLTTCLVQEDSWPQVPEIINLLKAEFGYSDTGVQVKVVVTDVKGYSGRKAFTIGEQVDTASSEWTRRFNVSSYMCTINAKIDWQWQLQPLEGYFTRPKLVPASQALFAAYDQFASKLPAYSEQVLERLRPQKSSWKSSWFGSLKPSVLPYKTTDGRFLHRNLKKGEHENLKVHAGDLGSDDAVFNFPKAWDTSKYAHTPTFHYNAGLSLANLFLRSVSDIQALFFLYFANHPDWDGKCTSLPAKFNLFHEHPNRDHAWDRTNWEREATHDSSGGRHHRSASEAGLKISHRANGSVSVQGEPMTEDDMALFHDWHWISKPYWLGKEAKRAAFMTRTPPTHGKDGWATPNVSSLSSEMWPHIWCELVNQHWSENEADVVLDNTKNLSSEAAGQVSELLEAVEANADASAHSYPDGSAAEIFSALGKTMAELRSDPFTCKEMNNEDKDEKRKLMEALGDLGRSYGDALSHAGIVWKHFKEITDFLRVDLDEAAQDQDEARAKKMQGELVNLETTVDVISRLKAEEAFERTNLEALNESILKRWELNSEGAAADPGEAAKHLAQFESTTAIMERNQEEKERLFEQAKDQIERFMKGYPYSPEVERVHMSKREGAFEHSYGDDDNSHADDEDDEDEDADKEDADKKEIGRPSDQKLKDIKEALEYSGTLLTGARQSQKRLLGEFKLLFSCVDLAARPVPLSRTRFLPWVPEDYKDRASHLQDLLKTDISMETLTGLTMSGVELIFEKACRVSPDFEFGSGGGDEASKFDDEPRHECERVTLTKHLLTIFPSFAHKVVDVFNALMGSLDQLMEDPMDKKIYQEMERTFIQFLESLGGSSEELDRDFYTAFAYKGDGSLFGELWVSLADSSAKIMASLQERTSGSRNWIAESIRDKVLLSKGRRARVRQPQKPKAEVPAEIADCVCKDDWSAWVWHTLPYKRRFHGCANFSSLDGGQLSIGNTTGWKGFCQSQSKKGNIADCLHKWAPCDPSKTSDTRKEYRIWRKGRSSSHLTGDSVTLPLVQMDLYLSFDVRSSRADFCTPNFAPIIIKKTKHWSSSSWMPWEVRETGCWGVRLHPPGISALILRCEHGEPGKKGTPASVEWQVVITAYLISYYNVWGTTDGDMTSSWFDGSWGAVAANKGIDGVLTGTSNWANKAGGYGYLSTARVMQSGPGFWLAAFAEAIGAFQASKFISSQSGHKLSAIQTMSAVGLIFWRVMQRWGVVPLQWSLGVSVEAVSKYMPDVTGVTLSGWRNEHDVVLAVRWSHLSRKSIRYPPDLIRAFNAPQLRRAMEVGEKQGYAFAQRWREHQQKIGYTQDNLLHLSHAALGSMIKTWLKEVAAKDEQLLNNRTKDMFTSCISRRPRWYKVKENSSHKVHAFYGKSYQKWLQGAKEPGSELFLIDGGDGWFTEIKDPSEEDRYYPRNYAPDTLTVQYDVVEGQGRPDRQLLPHELEYLLHVASMKDLQCWATFARHDNIGVLHAVQAKYREDGEDIKEDGVLPVAYFSEQYTREFLVDSWWHFVGDSRKKKHELAEAWFKRGRDAQYKLKGHKEVGKFSKTDWAVSLSLRNRIGLPFLKVPAILQVQPYAELTISFNMKQVVSAVQTRIGVNGTPSILESHQKRINKCMQCVAKRGMAFCDRHYVATDMLEGGWREDMDTCLERTVENKKLCRAFAFALNVSEGNGSEASDIFKEQKCPCYGKRSGMPTVPRWITSSDHCSEMRWPNADSENDRRQMKATDWQFGFTSSFGKSTGNRLRLNDQLEFEPQSKGCEPGYRCCMSVHEGAEILRCVELEGIKKTATWFARRKCKNYRPDDITTSKAWSHTHEFHCAPGRGSNHSRFNGTWRVDGNKWVEKVVDDSLPTIEQ